MRQVYRFGFLVVMGFLGCTVPPPSPPPSIPPQPKPTPFVKPSREGPEIRVGIAEGLHQIEWTPLSPFQIRHRNGLLLAGGIANQRWRISVERSVPGSTIFRLVAGSMRNHTEAVRRVKELKTAGIDAEIRVVGRPLFFRGFQIPTNRYFRVYLTRRFQTREIAAAFRDSLSGLVDTFIVREASKKAEGLFHLANLETGEVFQSSGPVWIQRASVILHDLIIGKGFHWEHAEDQTYPETVLFDFDPDGNLVVVNRIPLEYYLAGVLPSEMPPGFPFEALKAQAIAARSKVLGTWGLSHNADPFDVCGNVHCQVYSGLSKRHIKTDRAVSETVGLVLFHEDQIVDAVFGGVCGGHTEDVERAWGTRPNGYLKGRPDGKAASFFGSLTEEVNARRWIDATPEAFCNTISGPLPPALEYTRKYYRWDIRLRQEDLRASLAKRGIDVGEITDLVPLERGVSGRIVRLKVVGTKAERILRGELTIRQTLSSTTLWSSCFYPIKQGESFLLKGAGWGHGVGMCQTGAAGMALKGKNHREILSHYYRHVQVRRVY